MTVVEVHERIRKRLVANVYVDSVIDYVSQKFGVPKEKISIVFEPVIARTVRPDLVLIYDNTWFVVEFKTRPNPTRDLMLVTRYRQVINEYVKPRKTIPILAYVYNAPTQDVLSIANELKPPLVILLLAHGTYRVLYENV